MTKPNKKVTTLNPNVTLKRLPSQCDNETRCTDSFRSLPNFQWKEKRRDPMQKNIETTEMELDWTLKKTHVIQKMDEWSKDYDLNKIIRIEGNWVHKTNPKNICISRIEPLETKDHDGFIFQVAVDISNPFFFDHPYDHVPGMLILEAGRQAGTAVSHLFCHVSCKNIFVLKGLKLNFYNFATVNKPLFCLSRVSEKKYRKGELHQMTYGGVFTQGGRKIAHMEGAWNIFSKKVTERMKRF